MSPSCGKRHTAKLLRKLWGYFRAATHAPLPLTERYCLTGAMKSVNMATLSPEIVLHVLSLIHI